MHAKLGSSLLVLVSALYASPAQAQVDWATCDPSDFPVCSTTRTNCCYETGANLNVGGTTNRPIIIPMDRCHQTYANNDYPDVGPPDNSGNGWCADPAPNNPNSMFYAYGLVYRLMQRGIPVHWIVNPTKRASATSAFDDNLMTHRDVDMWILSSGASIRTSTQSLTNCGSSCTPPVKRLNTTTLAAINNTYTKQEFPLRGSVFMISGGDSDGDGTSDRVEFNTFWGTYGDGTPGSGRTCGNGDDCYDFTDVNLYEIQDGATVRWTNHTTDTNQTANTVPIAVKITYTPPRIARVEPGGSVSTAWLGKANLDDEAGAGCASGAFVPSDAVWCELDETDVNNNRLVSGGFGWAWMDGGNGFDSCQDTLIKMRTFLSGMPGLWNAGNLMANDTKLEEVEKCDNYQLLGQQGPDTASLGVSGTTVNEQKTPNWRPMLVRYPTNLFMQYGDITIDFASSSVAHWTTNATRRYSSKFNTGTNTLKRLVSREAARTASNPVCNDTDNDGSLDSNETPHFLDIFPHADATACDGATTAGGGDAEDVMAYGRHDNNQLNGLVFYTAGNQIANKAAELRMVLNSIIATPNGSVSATPTTFTEIARSTPVVPFIDTGTEVIDVIVQGTAVYETPVSTPRQVLSDADAATFQFPYRKGHLRARRADNSDVMFDAGCNSTVGGLYACPTTNAINASIPDTTLTFDNNGGTATGCTFPKDASNANCRTIFTSLASGDLRTQSLVYFDEALPTAGKDLIKLGINLQPATVNTIIQRVIAGHLVGTAYVPMLGGVNRSTPAVIPASTVAGDPSRVTMAYFGAEDGMLHAVCAGINAAKGCDKIGRELWAYIPRTQLPQLRNNHARVDGSPRVIDAYIDIDGGAYNPSWRTVLLFQTGSGDATDTGRVPAVYALDVSDPRSPKVLWEHSMSSVTSRGTYELGVGLGLAAGPITISGATKYAAFAQTNNLGTLTSVGSVVTAINIEDGTRIWQQGYAIPGPRVSTNDPVVSSGIPAGVVPVDLAGSGRITDLTWTDLYGQFWMADPVNGTSRNGTAPLFKVSQDYRAIGAQPAIFGVTGSTDQFAVLITGGYQDPSNTTWPMECCKSSNGTSCDATQPSTPQTCAQYNNTTQLLPTQYAIGVKLNSSLTSSVSEPAGECDSATTLTPNLAACANTNIRFKRNLGPDERGYTAPLVIGTQIFFTTDNQNVNSFDYVGGASGKLYSFNTDGGSSSSTFTTVLTTGATGLAASNNSTGARTIYGGTNSGSFFSNATDGSTGVQVETGTSSKSGRKLWLRTE